MFLHDLTEHQKISQQHSTVKARQIQNTKPELKKQNGKNVRYSALVSHND